MTPALRRGVPAAILLLAVVILVWPLLTTAALPAGSDVVFAYHSAYGFAQALSEGVLYPRWVANSNNGFGGATFIYYCPLPYYAVALAGMVTSDQVNAFRLVLILVALLSGWTLYRAARPLTTPTGAALAAAAYILVPYHALDLYDRFAFAEYCSFIWFPLIVLGLRRVVAEGRRHTWPALAAAFTGLLFTHLVTAYMVGLVLGPYALYLALRRKEWRGLVTLAAAGAVALLAAAVYLLPMLVQRPEVHLEWVVNAPYGDWRRNFVYRDEVAFGYAHAPIKTWVNKVASTQALLSLAAAALCLMSWRRRDVTRPDVGGPDPRQLETEALTMLALWTFFLQIPLSAFIWSLTPELGTVQFPWRFGLFQGLVTALLVGHVWAPAPTDDAAPGPATLTPKHWLKGVILGVAALPALWVSLSLMNHPLRPLSFDATLAGRPYYISRVMTEYLPRDMEGWREFIDQPPDLRPQAQWQGDGTATVTLWETHRRIVRVRADAGGRLAMRTFHHPGWVADIDGKPVPIEADNPLHLITVPVEAGEHEVTFRFAATGDRHLGGALSMAGLATIATFAWRQRRGHRFTRSKGSAGIS